MCNKTFREEVEELGVDLTVIRRFAKGSASLLSASLFRTRASIACSGVDNVPGVASE